MTNDPPYDQQLALLKQMSERNDFANPSSNTPLPGNVSPTDRFQRAAYYQRVLPEPKKQREAVASMFAIMANVSVPFLTRSNTPSGTGPAIEALCCMLLPWKGCSAAETRRDRLTNRH